MDTLLAFLPWFTAAMTVSAVLIAALGASETQDALRRSGARDRAIDLLAWVDRTLFRSR